MVGVGLTKGKKIKMERKGKNKEGGRNKKHDEK